MTIDEKFAEWDAGERVLIGAQCLSSANAVGELAGVLGFDLVWYEMEHGGLSMESLQALCQAACAGGAAPVPRLPDHNRFHVMRALEVGARMTIVPMVNTAEIAAEMVQWGKFPPVGARGYNFSSRGLKYGVGAITEIHDWADKNTHLIAQIETVEAVDNIDEIVAVDGISGVFVGPGDLSCYLGCPGEFDNPELLDAVATVIKKTKAAGKHAGLLGPEPLLRHGLAAGADFIFCANDIRTLASAWGNVLTRARDGFAG